MTQSRIKSESFDQDSNVLTAEATVLRRKEANHNRNEMFEKAQEESEILYELHVEVKMKMTGDGRIPHVPL